MSLCDLELGSECELYVSILTRELGGNEVKLTKITFQFIDKSTKYPYGIIEDLMVKVENMIFLADFIVFNTQDD